MVLVIDRSWTRHSLAPKDYLTSGRDCYTFCYTYRVRSVTDDYRILESALKHGISELEIAYVLDFKNPTRRYYAIHDDGEGNGQDMVVAHTGTRPWAIEVGVCYRAEENVVFHASKVTPKFQTMYEAEP